MSDDDPRDQFEYDLALSFAGEDRSVAEHLARLLVADGVRVFYDAYEAVALWGKDLYQHLQSIYRDRARYCIVFVSSAYERKLSTKHELRQAQARAFRENQEYILPVRLDDSEIPGLNATTGYIDLRERTVEQLHRVVIEKLFGSEVAEEELPELTWKGDLVDFRGTQVASFWPAKLEREQKRTTFVVKVPRIRYGDESWDCHADEMPCHDCAAVKGDFTQMAAMSKSAPCAMGKRSVASASSSRLLPNIGLQPTAAGAALSRRG